MITTEKVAVANDKWNSKVFDTLIQQKLGQYVSIMDKVTADIYPTRQMELILTHGGMRLKVCNFFFFNLILSVIHCNC